MDKAGNGNGRLLAPRNIAAKVLTGFMLGIGFAIPFFSIEVILSYIMTRNIIGMMSESREMRPFGPDARLEIVSHEAREAKYGLELLVTLKNAGETKWENMRIEVVFYDTENRPNGHCLGYNFVPIRAGEEKFFQFNCHNAPTYSRYTIQIVEATHSLEP